MQYAQDSPYSFLELDSDFTSSSSGSSVLSSSSPLIVDPSTYMPQDEYAITLPYLGSFGSETQLDPSSMKDGDKYDTESPYADMNPSLDTKQEPTSSLLQSQFHGHQKLSDTNMEQPPSLMLGLTSEVTSLSTFGSDQASDCSGHNLLLASAQQNPDIDMYMHDELLCSPINALRELHQEPIPGASCNPRFLNPLQENGTSSAVSLIGSRRRRMIASGSASRSSSSSMSDNESVSYLHSDTSDEADDTDHSEYNDMPRTRSRGRKNSQDISGSCASQANCSSSQATVPVQNLTRRSRGRRVPTTSSIASQGGIQKNGVARTYICTVDGCGKCFIRGEHLKRHIRSIHTNERPYKCPDPSCGKEFSRHDNLGQHMHTHKGYVP